MPPIKKEVYSPFMHERSEQETYGTAHTVQEQMKVKVN